jgi:GAF domain-containing protein
MTIESKYFNSGILINKLLRVSSSLSSEKDLAQILENILDAAMDITGADEGTIYKVTSDNLLITEIVQTKSKENSLAGNGPNRSGNKH